MNFKEFEEAVRLSLKSLPSLYLQVLEKEEINIIPREKVPSGLKELHPGKTVFGAFIGTSRKDRTIRFTYPEPTRIELYMESYERAYGSGLGDNVRQQIKKTLIHEIAHYMGFSESQIRYRGY